MKFKEYIHSEINQKEVEPSHDAWDRIQARMQNQPEVVEETSTKKWWAIAAGVVGLAVCTMVFFNTQKTSEVLVIKHEKAIPVNTDIKSTNTEDILNIELVEEPKYVDSKSIIDSKETEKNEIPTQIVNQNSINLEKNELSKIEVEKLEIPPLASGLKQTNIVTNLDTLKVNPKKKTNYVDPNMLLYSIENKESLKETNNQKSKVAIIDLNK